MNLAHIAIFLCVISYVNTSKESAVDSTKQETSSVLVEVEDPIANGLEYRRFKEAVHKGDLRAAWGVFCKGSDELKKHCGEYLVGLGSSRLVKLIKGADDHGNEWLLQVILVYADQPLINDVFNAVKPSNYMLRRVACECRLGLHASTIHLSSREN